MVCCQLKAPWIGIKAYLDIRACKPLANESPEVADGIPHIHRHRLGSIATHIPPLVIERNSSGSFALRLLVHENIDAALAGKRHARTVVPNIKPSDTCHGSGQLNLLQTMETYMLAKIVGMNLPSPPDAREDSDTLAF